MKKLTTKRLAIRTETLRCLDDQQLERAIGGGNGSINWSCGCATGGICLPPTTACNTDVCQTGLHCI